MKLILLLITNLFILGCNGSTSTKVLEEENLSDRIDTANLIDSKNANADTIVTIITTDKTVYGRNEVITVSYKHLLGEGADWIGLYPKNANNAWENVVDWTWAKGVDEGNVTFKAPELGEYQARVFFKNSFYAEANTSFMVTEKISTEETASLTSIQTDKTSYELNESIVVSYQNLSGDEEDWVGIYPKGTNNDWDNVVDWAWASGIKEGSVTFNLSSAGEYEARLFFRNSFVLEASTAFSMKASEVKNNVNESINDSIEVNDASNVASVSTLKYPKQTTLTSRPTDESVLKPEVNKPSYDTFFETRLRKVNKSDTSIGGYPKMQSWNKDMTLMRIGSRLYDAETLEESALTKKYGNHSQAFHGLCSRSSDNFRWSNQEADTFYVLDTSKRLIKGQIKNGTIECSDVMESFADFTEIHLGPHEGNIDKHDRYVVFLAKKSNDTTAYVVLYDIKHQKRLWTKVLPSFTWAGTGTSWSISELDWVSVSPSGKYILVNARKRANFQEGMYLYDINMENPKKIQFEHNGKRYSEGGHGDIGFDMQGNEVLVQFLSGLGVYAFNLDKPDEMGKKVLHPYGGGHVSCRNFDRPGWCYMTTFEKNYRQVYAVKLDGTSSEIVENFSQFHVEGYFLEVYGSPSPDGTKMIFNSNWGNATTTIDTFVVDVKE